MMLRPTGGWRLLLEPAGDPAWNMAADESLLEALAAGEGRPTLRIYGWSCPAVSIGRFQPLQDAANYGISEERRPEERHPEERRPEERHPEERRPEEGGPISRGSISPALCRRLGLPLVRRPTGGRAILHGRDVTYSVVIPHGGMGVVASYRQLSEAIRIGLRRLGIETRIGRAPAVEGFAAASCFAAATRADLIADLAGGPCGEPSGGGCGMAVQAGTWRDAFEHRASVPAPSLKLVGSAQCRHGAALLQQGTIPLAWDRERFIALFGAEPHASGAGCLADLLGRTPPWGEAAEALAAGFAALWGPPVVAAGLHETAPRPRVAKV